MKTGLQANSEIIVLIMEQNGWRLWDIHILRRVNAQTTRKMGFFNKADVLVLVDNSVEWVSVKKFTSRSSFNQIDKRWVSEFAKHWKMSDAVTSALKMYCGEDGYKPGETNEQISSSRDTKRFFMDELPDETQKLVVSFLDKKKRRIIHEVIAGPGERELLNGCWP